jgi:hypothetical protein
MKPAITTGFCAPDADYVELSAQDIIVRNSHDAWNFISRSKAREYGSVIFIGIVAILYEKMHQIECFKDDH